MEPSHTIPVLPEPIVVGSTRPNRTRKSILPRILPMLAGVVFPKVQKRINAMMKPSE
jgi:hypothetical protein